MLLKGDILRKSIINLKFFVLGLLLVGCGYKPTTTYTTPILGENIYTKVEVNIKNPIDSIFLKDALNEAVVSVFNAKIGLENSANSSINLTINSVNIYAIDYDKNGYPILYRAQTSISAGIIDINKTYNSYSASGSYDFSIASNAVLSDDIKHNAIKEAFLKALQMIEFKIAQKGIKSDDNKSN